MSAAFHRAVSLDTRISVAIAELSVGMRVDPALAARLGIGSELEHVVATLTRHLDTLRAELHRMTDDPYQQQPGVVRVFIDLGIGLCVEVDARDVDLQRWTDDGGNLC